MHFLEIKSRLSESDPQSYKSRLSNSSSESSLSFLESKIEFIFIDEIVSVTEKLFPLQF